MTSNSANAEFGAFEFADPEFDWTATMYGPSLSLQGAATPGALQNPIIQCRDAELGLYIEVDAIEGEPYSVTLSLDLLTPNRYNFTVPRFAYSGVSSCGPVAVTATSGLANPPGSGISTTDMTNFAITFVVDDQGRDVELRFRFTQTGQVNGFPNVQSNSRMSYCQGVGCTPPATTSPNGWNWDFSGGLAPDAAVASQIDARNVVAGATTASPDPQDPTVAGLIPADVVVTGDVLYSGAWYDPTPATIFMAPGTRWSFTNAAATTVAIPGATFMPCADAAWDRVEVDGNTTLQANGTAANPFLIYGADLSLDLEPGGSITGTEVYLDGNSRGLFASRPGPIVITGGASGTDLGLRPAETPYVAPGGTGSIGVSVNSVIATNTPVRLNNFAVQDYHTGIRGRGRTSPRISPIMRLNNVSVTGDGAEVGVDYGYCDDGTFLMQWCNIAVQGTAVRWRSNDRAFLFVGSSTLSAGEIGIDGRFNRSGGIFVNANTVTNTRNAGISIVERRAATRAFVNANTITIPTDAVVNSAGVELIGVSRGSSTLSGQVVDMLGPDGYGIYSLDNDAITVTNNQVRLDAVSLGVGIEHELNTNLTSFCNTAIGNRALTRGILVAGGLRNDTFDCNTLDHLGGGMVIDGINNGVVYSRNGMFDNTVGLQVGSDPSNNDAQVRIGGTQLDRGNVWPQQLGLTNSADALHSADPDLRTTNAFQTPDVDPYYALNADNVWFTQVSNSPIPATCPTQCYVTPPPIPRTPPCPEVPTGTDATELGPVLGLYHMHAARDLARRASDLPLADDCVETIPPCYTELAALELEWRLLMESERLTSASREDMDGATLAFLNGGSPDSLLAAYGTVAREGSLDSATTVQYAQDIRVALDELTPCDTYSGLYADALELMLIEAEHGELTPSEATQAQTIADLCPTTDGPGVHLARTISPQRPNAVAACNFAPGVPPTQGLRLEAVDAKLLARTVYRAGEPLMLSPGAQAPLELVDVTGQVHRLQGASDYFAPPVLGTYVIRGLDEEGHTITQQLVVVR